LPGDWPADRIGKEYMKKKFNRVFVIVLDGVGVGEAPDAEDYGDKGSNSVGNTSRTLGGLDLPNMGRLGLGNVVEVVGVPPEAKPMGAYGKCLPNSAGKCAVSGHWELMGVYLKTPFPTYPNGFPQVLLDEFKKRTGLDVLGNKPASGTVIIQELGEEHMRTGKPILYTSADSVWQIAAHEDIIPIDRLYELCVISREMLTGEHNISRIIARPFIGDRAGNFTRTPRRRDYPLRPIKPTVMDKLVAAGKEVYTTGKIDDLFAGQGITHPNHTTNNEDSIKAAIEFLKEDFEGLLFANLIEFDMIYGHRNDPQGYGAALQAFDRYLPTIQSALRDGDMVIISADHGVDPTTPSTDHSRECVPLLVFGPRIRPGVNLGARESFSDVAATICEIFDLDSPEIGRSFLKEVIKK